MTFYGYGWGHQPFWFGHFHPKPHFALKDSIFKSSPFRKDWIPNTELDGVLDPTGQDGGFMFSGSGNSVDDFLIQRNLSLDVEGAIKVKYRQGQDFDPESVGPGGVPHYSVPAGPQVVDPAHGVPVANANRAAWSFDFSVNSGIDGSSTTLGQLLFKYTATLKFDIDPSDKVNYYELTLKKAPVGHTASESGYVWTDKFGNIIIGDDGGNAQVTQNSFNYAFIASKIDTNPWAPGIQPYTFGAGQFDIELEVKSKFGFNKLLDLHTIVDVGQEASPWDGPLVFLNADLAPTAQETPGNIFQGSGNNEEDFQISRNSVHDLEAGIRLHYRQGENIEASYLDDDTFHFIVPDGPQVVDPAHGVPVANANRAAWSFTLSVDSGIEGSTKTIADHLDSGADIFLRIDMDPRVDQIKFLNMELVEGGASQSGYQWIAADNLFVPKGTVLIPDDEGNAQVTQNDRNISFYTSFIDANPNVPGQQAYTFGPGEFDIELVGYKGFSTLFDVDAVVHVI